MAHERTAESAAGEARKARTRERNREVILTAAIRVFLEQGYDGVSMDSVAEAAGVARRTLYNQFPEGKESLFFAATEQFWGQFPTFEWGDGEEPASAVLRQAGEAIAQFWSGEAMVRYLRLAIAETARFPELMGEAGRKGMLPMMEQMALYLERESKRGRLQIADPTLAMRQFFGLVCEPLLWPRVVGLRMDVRERHRVEVVEGAVKMFLLMYGVQPGSERS